MSDSRERLLIFLDNSKTALRDVFNHPRRWLGDEAGQHIQELAPLAETRFSDVRVALAKATDDDLSRVGFLDPREVGFKLLGPDKAYESYRKTGTRQALIRFLHWANKIFESLAQVIPGAEGVKEIKDAVEGWLDEDRRP